MPIRAKTLSCILVLAMLAPGCRPVPIVQAPIVAPNLGPVPPPGPSLQLLQNPLLVPVGNADLLWETLVDTVDDFFHIRQEQRVRQLAKCSLKGGSRHCR